MNRRNGTFRGKHNNRFGNKRRPWRNHQDAERVNVEKNFVAQEKLKEIEVGITEYISKLDGFSGIIKARFSDFHVNEINLDGEIAKLTNTRYPDDFNEERAKVPDDVTQISKPVEQLTDEQWKSIIDLLVNQEEADKTVEVDVTEMTKEDRSKIHIGIKKVLQNKIIATTVTKLNDKKYIQIKQYTKGNKDNRVPWPANTGEYVHFLVYKESIDTLEASFKISDCLRMKAASFTYAGVKDKRAKTTQWFCVRKVQPSKLVFRTKQLRNIHIGNFTFKDKPLKLGQLLGNRFRIALRNVTVEDSVIDEALNFLKANGFINYYGLQRFGNDKEVPTFDIGVKLLQGNWKEACGLILKLKSGEDTSTDLFKAKKVYQETSDAKKACEELTVSKNKCLEAKLLYGLSIHGENDYVNALEQIPRSMRLLYIHSFQSLIWNKIVSKRIAKFGLKPIVGDLVLISQEGVNLDNIDGEEDEDGNEKDPNKSEDKEADDECEPRSKQEVKILTEKDLSNYTMYDIVLPLPGYDIKYPENETKDWYKELLEEVDLSLEMPKQKVKTYTLSGAYRKILEKARDLSWYTIRYNDPCDNLILSDYGELRGCDAPVNHPDGKYKALVVDFCLNSSSYATMVLREILKTDTSSTAHTKLNNYHESEPVQARKEEKIEYNKPQSLLSDPQKYADFKNAIFGADDSEKRKTDEEEECLTNAKKKMRTNAKDDGEEEPLKVSADIL